MKCRGRCSTPLRSSSPLTFPIFTLQRVEGRLFRPMAWTVAFALLRRGHFFDDRCSGAGQLSISKDRESEWENPVLVWITKGYRHAVTWTVHHKWVMVGIALIALSGTLYLGFFQRRHWIGIPASSGRGGALGSRHVAAQHFGR